MLLQFVKAAWWPGTFCCIALLSHLNSILLYYLLDRTNNIIFCLHYFKAKVLEISTSIQTKPQLSLPSIVRLFKMTSTETGPSADKAF